MEDKLMMSQKEECDNYNLIIEIINKLVDMCDNSEAIGLRDEFLELFNVKYSEPLFNVLELQEDLGCPLEVVIGHINESYKMLCQHIEINEKYVELKKYRDIAELSKISYDIALSKEQKGLCENYFTWLKKDKSE